MGCAFSRQGGHPTNGPYNAPAPNTNTGRESSRHITADSAPDLESSQAGPSRSKSVAPNVPLYPLDPNRRAALPNPLSSPTSTSSQNPASTPWTRSKLEKERKDWWDTQVTGNIQIWGAYRQMVEFLQQGDVHAAQTILDATGCTCPTGRLWQAIYDESGVEYRIQDERHDRSWLVFEPDGLAEEPPADTPRKESLTTLYSLDKLPSNKGKGRADDEIQVRCRLSSNQQDYIIRMHKDDKIITLMRKLGTMVGAQMGFIRVIHFGVVLYPDDTLPMTGVRAWVPGHVLTVLIREED